MAQLLRDTRIVITSTADDRHHFRPREVTCKEFASLGDDLAVIIPIYGVPDTLPSLLNQLHQEVPGGWSEVRVVVVDDASVGPTASIRELCSDLGYTWMQNDHNLGFGSSVNAALSSLHERYALIINSDVLIPRGFLAMLSSVALQTRAALVTTPSFHDAVQWGADSSTWSSSVSKEQRLEVMRACTAVGYALLIDGAQLADPVFSPDYGLGYGEDSDLHYRVATGGRDSVVVVGPTVAHAGGRSFDLHPRVDIERKQGAELFHTTWGAHYRREWPLFRAQFSATARRIERLTNPRVTPSKWLFVLPGYDPKIGGLRILGAAAGELALRDETVLARSLSAPTVTTIEGLLRVSEWDRHGAVALEEDSQGYVVTGGNAGLRFLEQRQWHIGSRKLIWVLQGHDFLTEPGMIRRYHDAFRRSEVVVCASDDLSDLAQSWGAESTTRFSPLAREAWGSSTAQGSIRPWSNRTWDVLVQARSEPGKAPWLARAIAEILGVRGMKVRLVEHDLDAPSYANVSSIPALPDSAAFFRELNDSKIYIDTSLHEGFGLVPREALIAGCRVLSLESGGVDALIRQGYIDTFSSGHVERVPGLVDAMLSSPPPEVGLDDLVDAPGLGKALATWSESFEEIAIGRS